MRKNATFHYVEPSDTLNLHGCKEAICYKDVVSHGYFCAIFNKATLSHTQISGPEGVEELPKDHDDHYSTAAD